LFKKILIANRGEIALRIIRACREMGITPAAVYSEADISSEHVRYADESYFIGEAAALKSYLDKDKIIKLAKKINADAIHPGYGFFSENPDFIAEVEKTGIEFIGPSSESVRKMGSKTAARKLMIEYGVPIVPGLTAPLKSVEEGIIAARDIGYPVLLKASSGGGGKGMRKIHGENEFSSAFEAVKREAFKAFADDSVYIEKYIEDPRHIEVQFIADKFGNYAHLFERDCSVQRRHQKIIEEAPSYFIDDTTREKITRAAINAAKACDYFNAGTVEFLMDKQKNFYFLEMNTRLQVEHPVTEQITGIDLVKEQISIAAGKKLSLRQEDLKINGHAIECRIYAEDPANNFLPAAGTIKEYSVPGGPGVRVDGGFNKGSEISVFYDPMIAKLICFGPDRKTAIERMQRALSEYQVTGLINNIPFLKSVISDADFISGDIDINYIERNSPRLIAASDNSEYMNAAVLLSVLLNSKNTLAGSNNTNGNTSVNKWSMQQYD
jgi:acetyl-CoA carboxylase biotin carboxylase subunit